MPLTPYQLPSPRELTPYTEDQSAMRLLGDPFTAKQGSDILTNLRSKHALEQQQYGEYLDQAHQYGQQVLGAQRQDIALDAIPKFLAQPQGFNVMMGAPAIRSVLSQLSPDMAQALGQQNFVSSQAKSMKDVADAVKLLVEGGTGVNNEDIQRLLGVITNAITPLSLQVEQERTRGQTEAARIKADADSGLQYTSPPQPSLGGGTVSGKLGPGTIQQGADRLRQRGVGIPTPTSLPPRYNKDGPNPLLPQAEKDTPAPTAPQPGSAAAAAIGQPTQPPNEKDLLAGPMADNFAANWAQLKSSQGLQSVLGPDGVAAVDALAAKRGGKPAIDMNKGMIYGIDPKTGGYIGFPLKGGA